MTPIAMSCVRKLFVDGYSRKNHRQLDEEVLGLDRNISRGYQSMGILHFLGLKADFHGIFQAISESQVIGLLKADEQDFSSVISFLESGRSAINIKALIETETAEIAKSRTDTSVARNERILNAEKRPKDNGFILIPINGIQILLLRHCIEQRDSVRTVRILHHLSEHRTELHSSKCIILDPFPMEERILSRMSLHCVKLSPRKTLWIVLTNHSSGRS